MNKPKKSTSKQKESKAKMNFYHMTHVEGVSYDRVAGYKGTKEPTRQDKDTVNRVLNKVGDGILTYHNGAKIQVDLRRDENE